MHGPAPASSRRCSRVPGFESRSGTEHPGSTTRMPWLKRSALQGRAVHANADTHPVSVGGRPTFSRNDVP